MPKKKTAKKRGRPPGKKSKKATRKKGTSTPRGGRPYGVPTKEFSGRKTRVPVDRKGRKRAGWQPNSNQADTIEVSHRRALLAEGRAKGLTFRECQVYLAERGCVSKTGRPWTLDTLSRDAAAIERAWMDRALQERDKHKGRILAQLHLVLKQAFASGELENVLKSLKQEVHLLGVAAPQKVAHTDPSGEHESKPDRLVMSDMAQLSPEVLERLAQLGELLEGLSLTADSDDDHGAGAEGGELIEVDQFTFLEQERDDASEEE